MLKIIGVHSLAINSIVGENSTINEVDNSEVKEASIGTKIAKSKRHDKSKDQNLIKSFSANSQALAQGSRSGFLISGAKQAFIKGPMFYYFDPNYHIRIETDKSSYAISKILGQLTSNDLNRWHLVVFLSRRMILVKI